MRELENYATDLDLENQNKARKIHELEQWMMCLTNSTLVAAGSEKESKNFQNQINIVRNPKYKSCVLVY